MHHIIEKHVNEIIRTCRNRNFERLAFHQKVEITVLGPILEETR